MIDDIPAAGGDAAAGLVGRLGRFMVLMLWRAAEGM